MTIAISLKVNDGLVLAADSAATLFAQLPNGEQGIANVYNNANKIFNLRKGLPLGATTWGSGSIGKSSISTLMKDLRTRFSGKDTAWALDPDTYSVEDAARRVRKFMFEEFYQPEFDKWKLKPPLGFVVAGYSAGKPMAEEYLIQIQDGTCPAPSLLRKEEEVGMTWNGETEAISRLVLGFSTALPVVLQNNLGVPKEDLPGVLKVIRDGLATALVVPAMPIQDAIELATFLVYVTKQYSRFAPGATTVGGPIEIAAITKHEGFKWVRRKHYYSSEYNPAIAGE